MKKDRWPTTETQLGPPIGAINHHYATGASARAHLRQLIERGVIKGLRLERRGRALFVLPEVVP